jgi:Icc-related predicted phosphoesterase
VKAVAASGVRVAAVADLHMRPAVQGRFRPDFTRLAGRADLFLLAGDLTNGGAPEEAEILCQELVDLPVPVVAVLGNHDHDEGYGGRIALMLSDVGVRVLDGDGTSVDIGGLRVGVAGVMGGGGGFPGCSATSSIRPGDKEQEARLRRGPDDARRLRTALAALDGDVRIALMHFAPIADTLLGEAPGIFPGLGCHRLAEAVDSVGADLVVHGHAHLGSERGQTAGGVPVRNVAHPVLRRPYALYHLVGRRIWDVSSPDGMRSAPGDTRR